MFHDGNDDLIIRVSRVEIAQIRGQIASVPFEKKSPWKNRLESRRDR
jgi:hypothetical protein